MKRELFISPSASGLAYATAKLQKYIFDNLPWTEKAYGLATDGFRESDEKLTLTVPEVYVGGKKYKDVLPNRKNASQFFLYADGPETVVETRGFGDTKMSCDVSIVFWLDLDKINAALGYGYGHRFTDELIEQLQQVLSWYGDFRVERIERTPRKVWQGWTIGRGILYYGDYKEFAQTQVFKHPESGFRVHGKLYYEQDCSNTPIIIDDTYQPPAANGHHHDDRYYTETETDALLAAKSSTSHNHDTLYAQLAHDHNTLYYTKAEVDALVSGAGGGGGGTWGSITGTLSDQTDLAAALAGKSDTGHDHDAIYAPLAHNHDAAYATIGHNHDSAYAALSHTHTGVYEPVFTKNTAFNKNFGTAAGTVSEGNHTHSEYAPTGHTHDYSAVYAPLGHNHDSDYADISHSHAEYSLTTHDHDGVYATAGHTHDYSAVYAPLAHNHDSSYSPLGHTHDDRYYTESEVDAMFAGYTPPAPDLSGYVQKNSTTDYTRQRSGQHIETVTANSIRYGFEGFYGSDNINEATRTKTWISTGSYYREEFIDDAGSHAVNGEPYGFTLSRLRKTVNYSASDTVSNTMYAQFYSDLRGSISDFIQNTDPTSSSTRIYSRWQETSSNKYYEARVETRANSSGSFLELRLDTDHGTGWVSNTYQFRSDGIYLDNVLYGGGGSGSTVTDSATNGYIVIDGVETQVFDASGYSLTSHNHDSAYAAIGHDHDADYAAIGHTHSYAIGDLSNVVLTAPSNGQVLKFNGTNWVNDTDNSGSGTPTWGSITGTLSDQTDLNTALGGKADTGHNHAGVYEPVFAKNTGFNLNLGTTAGTVAEGNHTHSEYSLASHDHDSEYAAIGHNHTGVYEPAFTKNTGFNKNFGTSAGTVSEGNHTHSEYALSGHNHDATYSAIGHNHAGVYEPAFTKNSAFNKNFGTAAGTVSEGNHTHTFASITAKPSTVSGYGITDAATVDHNHDGFYEPVFTKNTAFNKNFGTAAGTVAEGNHTHDYSAVYAAIGHNHDGTYAASGHSHALADLSNVVLTSPSNGQVLKFNGTNWVNGADNTGAGGSYLPLDDSFVTRYTVSVTQWAEMKLNTTGISLQNQDTNSFGRVEAYNTFARIEATTSGGWGVEVSSNVAGAEPEAITTVTDGVTTGTFSVKKNGIFWNGSAVGGLTEQQVRDTALTGFAVGTTPVVATQSILQAIGNLQGQVNARAYTSHTHRHTRTITIPNPTASESITLFFTKDAITVNDIAHVVQGTSPSATFTIRYASARNTTGTEVVTGGTTANSAAGANVTSFNNGTIPANSWVWLTTSASSGVTELSVSLIYLSS